MFRKFDCGCIGIIVAAPKEDEARVWLIDPCDDPDGRGIHVGRRDSLLEKPSEPLSDTETDKLMRRIAVVVADGNALRELRTAAMVAGLCNGPPRRSDG